MVRDAGGEGQGVDGEEEPIFGIECIHAVGHAGDWIAGDIGGFGEAQCLLSAVEQDGRATDQFGAEPTDDVSGHVTPAQGSGGKNDAGDVWVGLEDKGAFHDLEGFFRQIGLFWGSVEVGIPQI